MPRANKGMRPESLEPEAHPSGIPSRAGHVEGQQRYEAREPRARSSGEYRAAQDMSSAIQNFEAREPRARSSPKGNAEPRRTIQGILL
ncbi:hypothetical protein DCS_03325 [Drechmeria coniospora]|uniref:Uncharacterized protein n=1 Tax=Drechmeria coniospora TaxID=98403 RepID=A0A151GGU4_DRECN|nr:hypothetical protein DCS_03325 [Drechmeria coniospora]KYK56327.1 hypothetical protein DCS_03325 [Drechmeria coniospora]